MSIACQETHRHREEREICEEQTSNKGKNLPRENTDYLLPGFFNIMLCLKGEAERSLELSENGPPSSYIYAYQGPIYDNATSLVDVDIAGADDAMAVSHAWRSPDIGLIA